MASADGEPMNGRMGVRAFMADPDPSVARLDPGQGAVLRPY